MSSANSNPDMNMGYIRSCLASSTDTKSQAVRLILHHLRYFTNITSVFVFVLYPMFYVVRRKVDIVFLATFVLISSTFLITNTRVYLALGTKECSREIHGKVTQIMLGTVHVGLWASAVAIHLYHEGSYLPDMRTVVSFVLLAVYSIISMSHELYFRETRSTDITDADHVVYFVTTLLFCFALGALVTMTRRCM